MSDRVLRRCKNTGICALAGMPLWTNSRKCRLCGRKMKAVQLSDRDYNHLELLAVEDPNMPDTNNSHSSSSPSSYNKDDRATISSSDLKGRSQTGYTPTRHGASGSGNDTFSNEDTYLKGCPLLKRNSFVKPLVKIPWPMYAEWLFLAKKFQSEWLLYLRGTHDQVNNVITITSSYIPKQRVGGAHVEVEPGQIVGTDTIGDVHSHNTMGAFFSGTDEAHFNWPIHLVINARGEICANMVVTLRCGEQAREEARILFIWHDDDAFDKRISELEAAFVDKTGPTSNVTVMTKPTPAPALTPAPSASDEVNPNDIPITAA